MEIKKLSAEELPQLMRFIDDHWSKGHILSHDIDVINWYYKCVDGNYNFLVGKEGDEIFGILGFIELDKFTSASFKSNEIWLALWKVRPDSPNIGLGLRLIIELKKLYPSSKIAVLGLSDDAEKIYKLLRYKVSSMNHFFIVNESLKDKFKIFKGEIPYFNIKAHDVNVSCVEDLSCVKESSAVNDDRGRDFDYFLNKYFFNKFNKYLFFRVSDSTQACYIFAKIDEANGARALRVVDIYGEISLFSKSIFWFYQFIKDESIEYMDIYYHGNHDELLIMGGMIKVSDNSKFTVPNYFSPFVQKNIDLKCAYNDIFVGAIYKGDGDQERPNRSM